jgi:glucose-6-phosphate 1-dehydrogenase
VSPCGPGGFVREVGLLEATSGRTYPTAPARAAMDSGSRLRRGHTAYERILAEALNADIRQFARKDMGEAVRCIVGLLSGLADEPVSYSRGLWSLAEAGRRTAVGRWYQPLEAAQ